MAIPTACTKCAYHHSMHQALLVSSYSPIITLSSVVWISKI